MLHHLSFAVRDLPAAARFYDAVLGALGYRRVFEAPAAIGYGLVDNQDKFCLKQRDEARAPSAGFHLAFGAPSREAVHAFHAAAMAAGGLDNGGPGPRPAYGPHYYAAFVIDPDGHRIEAVINTPVASEPADDRASAKPDDVDDQVAVSLDELLDALAWVDSDTMSAQAWVSRDDGRLLFGGMDGGEPLPEDVEDAARYAELPCARDLDLGHALVFDFVRESAPDQSQRVRDFFHRRGAWGRFKSLMSDLGLLDAWHRHEDEAQRRALREWAEAEGFRVVEGRRT